MYRVPNAKDAESTRSPRPVTVSSENRTEWCTSRLRMNASFSKSRNEASREVRTRSEKNGAVVASVAMPVGRTRPRRPVGAMPSEAASAKTAYVLTSPRPASGKRPEPRSRWLTPSERRRAAMNSACRARSASSSLVASASIRRSRAALLAAFATEASRVAKNSCSWSLTRSHGGFPSTQLNPPFHPVRSSTPGACGSASTRNTSGNSRCQWKKWYSARSRATFSTVPAGRLAPPSAACRASRESVVSAGGKASSARLDPSVRSVFSQTNAAHHASASSSARR
ncbi:hypothetical protein SCANM63S_00616 [Streptomyces canarius]